MRGTRRIAALAVLAAAFMVPIAGCGSSKSNSTTSTSTAAAGGGGSNVSLTATQYKFSPSDPSVKAGQVTFHEMNNGTVMHSLEIENVNGQDKELEGGVSPGQSGTLTVSLKPGKYEFYCPIDNHRGKGMTGEITVK